MENYPYTYRLGTYCKVVSFVTRGHHEVGKTGAERPMDLSDHFETSLAAYAPMTSRLVRMLQHSVITACTYCPLSINWSVHVGDRARRAPNMLAGIPRLRKLFRGWSIQMKSPISRIGTTCELPEP